ncbi:MAG: hypothetical protein HRU21_02300 [Pseudomonadales bacterium]|nr:hypothetical protein [Pseudomonadales bacterium]
MKPLFLMLLTILLTACDEGAPIKQDSRLYEILVKDKEKIRSSEGINLNDFRDADGEQTSNSKTIANCLYFNKITPDRTCSIAENPFIASSSVTPTKAQIMEKLIVSDQWMADNFAKVLDQAPAEMLTLFSSVTGIAIHRDIRPAYFWTATGGIYLDPIYLWETAEQLATVSQQQDFRIKEGGETLDYVSFTSYYKDGAPAWTSEADARDQQDVLYMMSALLFHELAHARDAYPVDAILEASSEEFTYQLADRVEDIGASVTKQLGRLFPLGSQVLKDLASIRYSGPNEELNITTDFFALSADDLAAEFVPDGANDDYSYYAREFDGMRNYYEDTAMLFEEAMLKIHFDIDKEYGFANIVGNQGDCSDYDVVMQITNRIFDDSVKNRASLVVNGLLPNNAYQAYFLQDIDRAPLQFCVPQSDSRSELSQSAAKPSTQNSETKPQLGARRWH